jgi:hypothetical protein
MSLVLNPNPVEQPMRNQWILLSATLSASFLLGCGRTRQQQAEQRQRRKETYQNLKSAADDLGTAQIKVKASAPRDADKLDPEGAKKRAGEHVSDVAEEKRAREELKRAEQKYGEFEPTRFEPSHKTESP